MWQLLNSVQSTKNDKGDDRDWMQTFCEEVVEPECVKIAIVYTIC